MLSFPLVSVSADKKAAPKKKPAAKQQAKKKQDQDWGRFNSGAKKDLDARDKAKAGK